MIFTGYGLARMLAEQVEQQAEKEGGKLHRTINFSHIPLIEDEVTFYNLESPYY